MTTLTQLRQHLERQLSELNAAEVDPVPEFLTAPMGPVLGPPPPPDPEPEPPRLIAPMPPWLVDDADQ